MDTSVCAVWLNTTFSGFDFALLEAMHGWEEIAGGVLGPVFQGISLVGEKGAIFFVVAFALMCFKRTRKAGICMFLAICLGALMTNIILKDLIARPRPFETMQVYFTWWEAAGAVPEDGFSFPSGHATAVSAGMISLALTQRNVRTFLIALTTMLLMGLARVYLFAHYPTDVLAGFLVGMLAAYIAFVLTHHIFVTRNPMIAAPKNPAGASKRGR